MWDKRAGAQETAFQIALRNYSKEAMKRARLYRSFATKDSNLNMKILLLIKENQIAQVKQFSSVLVIFVVQSLNNVQLFVTV